MKTTAFSNLARGAAITLALAGGLSAAQPAEDPIPKSFPADRYAKMAAHSPFTPPAPQAGPVVTPPPPPTPSFADKLTVVSAVDEGGGVYEVTVVDPDSSKHLYLRTDRVDEATQMQVQSVNWPKGRADQPGVRENPVVMIKKGSEIAQVRYEAGAAGSGPIGGIPGGAPGLNRPAIPGNAGLRPPGVPPPPPIPGSGTGGVAVTLPPLPAVPPNPMRRTPIRSFPQPTPGAAAAPTGARPVLPGNTTTSAQPLRPGMTKVDDDDDDDDE